MNEEPKTKCSELGFKHSWNNTTPNIVYPTNPAQYPDNEETCDNCGLKRISRREIREWTDYILPKD